jgi:DNA-binding transcriptional LysR family regulator
MDIQVLKNFLLLIQEKNVTRASEILHISQPTLSRQIQNLEEEFGQKLFYRNSKRVELTPYGKIMQQRANEIIYLYEKTYTEFNPYSDVISGEIRIALCESSASNQILSLAKDFQDEYPDTVLRFFSTSAEITSEMIESGIIDFGLFFGYADEKRFDSHRLLKSESRAALMPAGHPLSEKKELVLEDLKGWPLIVYQDAIRGTPALVEQGLISNDMKATFTSLFDAAKMVQMGLGIATIINDAIADSFWIQSSNFVTRPVTGLPLIPMFLAWKKNVILSKQAALLLQRLIENL